MTCRIHTWKIINHSSFSRHIT